MFLSRRRRRLRCRFGHFLRLCGHADHCPSFLLVFYSYRHGNVHIMTFKTQISFRIHCGLVIQQQAVENIHNECRTDESNYIFLMALARSSSGGVAISYVLPVLWMTPCFHILALWCMMCIPKWQ